MRWILLAVCLVLPQQLFAQGEFVGRGKTVVAGLAGINWTDETTVRQFGAGFSIAGTADLSLLAGRPTGGEHYLTQVNVTGWIVKEDRFHAPVSIAVFIGRINNSHPDAMLFGAQVTRSLPCQSPNFRMLVDLSVIGTDPKGYWDGFVSVRAALDMVWTGRKLPMGLFLVPSIERGNGHTSGGLDVGLLIGFPRKESEDEDGIEW